MRDWNQATVLRQAGELLEARNWKISRQDSAGLSASWERGSRRMECEAGFAEETLEIAFDGSLPHDRVDEYRALEAFLARTNSVPLRVLERGGSYFWQVVIRAPTDQPLGMVRLQRLSEVLEAIANWAAAIPLDQPCSRLSKEDQRLLSEWGISLSGGQSTE